MLEDTLGRKNATAPEQNKTGKDPTAISEPALVNNATETLTLSDEQKALLLHAAAKTILTQIYVPSKGHADEGLGQVNEWDDTLSVGYKHFTIRQSSHAIQPMENVKYKTPAKLAIGEAEWIWQGQADPILYVLLNDNHIVIEPFGIVTKASMEAVAESLVPLTVAALPAQGSEHLQVDKDYLMALRTATDFLTAWVQRDSKMGVQTVTGKIKSDYTEEELSAIFTGTSNPHHQAYEIMADKRLDKDTVRFKVWMYEHYTGEEVLFDHPEPVHLTVVRVDKDQWLVDDLPK